VGGPGSGKKSQSFKVTKAKEILKLSEAKIIKVLKGETTLPEKVVVDVALELYKRRIPTQIEGQAGNNSLTVVKIIKNHLPDSHGDVFDIETHADEIAEKVGEIVGRNQSLLHTETDGSSGSD
jgi:hypothetical protein